MKDLPVDKLVDAYIEKLLVLWYKRNRLAHRLPKGGVLPAVEHELNARTRGLKHMRVVKGSNMTACVIEDHDNEEVATHCCDESCQRI